MSNENNVYPEWVIKGLENLYNKFGNNNKKKD